MSEQEKPSKESSQTFINRWAQRKRLAKAKHNVGVLDENETEHAFTDPLPASVQQPCDSVSDVPTPDGQKTAHLSADAQSEQSQATANPSASIGTADKQAGTNSETSEQELLLTDLDMPSIESLSAESDLSVFFNKGVSAALRKAALRHVFQLPKFNVRDGLNDYDGDYTVFEPLGDTITSDMKWHIARKERARLEAEEQQRLELERLERERHEHGQAEEDDPDQSMSEDEVDGDIASSDSQDQQIQESTEELCLADEPEELDFAQSTLENLPISHKDKKNGKNHSEKQVASEALKTTDMAGDRESGSNKLRLVDLDTEQHDDKRKESEL